MRLTLGLVLVLLVGGSLALRQNTCPPERERQMDECAARMGFLGDHSFEVPQNSSAMEAFCSQMKQSIGCIQGYARDCLSGFTRSMLASLVKRGKQQTQSICQTPASRAKMGQQLACLSDKRIRPLHRQMDASVARFEYISDQVAPDRKMPALCCSYHIFNRDIETTLEQVCGKPTASNREQSANEFVRRIVSGTAGEFFDLICGEYKSIAECQAKKDISEVHRKLEDISVQVARGSLRPRNKSLVPVLLKILNNTQ